MKTETNDSTALRAHFVLALAIGSALEFYDFSVYSHLSEFIGPCFFPKSNPVAMQLSFWATFGVAFIVRPLGALAFGHVGDRHSRKNSLVWSLLLMAAPTALMGCIPSFSVISWAAPVLLVLLRLVQGFALGGENSMSLIYLFEAAPPAHRNLVVALGWSGIPLGIAAGIVVVITLSATCSRPVMEMWGWRVAMLFGGLTGAIGILLRRTMPDPALFLEMKRQINVEVELETKRDGHSTKVPKMGAKSQPSASSRVDDLWIDKQIDQQSHVHQTQRAQHHVLHSPALVVLRRHWTSVLMQFSFEMWLPAGFYTFGIVWPKLVAAHVPGAGDHTFALGVTLGAMLLQVPVAWLSGWLFDKGLPKMKTAAIIYLLAAASAVPAALMAPRSLAMAIFWQCWAVALIGVVASALQPSMCRLYPTEVRATGFGFAHQLASGPIGGVTPLVVSASALRLGPFGATAPWLAACAAVSLVTSVWLTLRHPELDRDLPEDQDSPHEGNKPITV